jgi:hypothetical protein
MSAHKPKRSRARFARSQADISALSSSEERSDREMEQERRFRASCPHSTASLPPQNRSPIQHTACFMASTTGKLVYKYGMNRWCNYDSSDPSFDRLTNPCIPGDCFHQNTKTIDPVLSTDPDTSYSSVGSNLASLLKPVEVNQNLDGYPNFESILNNDDVQILPVQSLEATEAVEAAEAAEVLPTTITLSPESGASPIEAMSASDSVVERPDITIVHASTSTPNTSNILNQDTAELSPANNQEVGGNYYLKNFITTPTLLEAVILNSLTP